MVGRHAGGRAGTVPDDLHLHPTGRGHCVRLDHVVGLAERHDERVEVVEAIGTPPAHA